MDLIQLSKEKGFMSRYNLVKTNANYKFLWMCEIQKWLRDKYHIYCRVASNSLTCHFPMNSILDIDGDKMMGPRYDKNYITYEGALEVGLYEALKLINL